MKCSVTETTDSDLRAQCTELLEADPHLGHLDTSTMKIWAALDEDGNVLGMAGLEWDAESRHAELVCCVIAPGARGRGLQQRLIKARIAWARKQGALSLETYASHDNLASIISLLKCGFQPKELSPEEEDGGRWLTVEYPL